MKSRLLVPLAAGAIAVLVAGAWWLHRSREVKLQPETTPAALIRADAQRHDDRWRAPILDAKATGTVERIKSMLGAIEPVLPGEVESAAALELLRWWAEIDPAAAIVFAGGNLNVHGRAPLAAELFIAWRDRKPEEARARFEPLQAPKLRAQILPAVISLVAPQQPHEALRLAAELTGENRRVALTSLFSEWGAGQPRAAAEAAWQLPDAGEQNLALRHVLGKWMDQDMNAAIAWAKSLPPDPAPGSLDVLPPVRDFLVEKWAARAPADAAAYLLTTPEGAGRMGLLRVVATQWAGANPAEGMQWATGVANDADRDVLVRGILAAVALTDVRAAAELAISTTHDRISREGLTLVMDQWNARDPAALTGWVNSILTRSDVGSKRETIVATWAAADLGAVERWVLSTPAGDNRDVGLAALAETWSGRDGRRALQWAEMIGDPGRRRERMDAITRRR
jgi:hypothetical protein